MVKKEFSYRGKSLEELQTLTINEFAEILPSRQRRSIRRGLTEGQKKLREKIQKKKVIKTHERDMIVLPEMVGKIIRIHSGKEFQSITITEDMLGLLFGELALTRRKVGHSAPGVGATRSSSALSVR
ncbi:MAG: 30S ribosomal protein S19 [archaeon]